MTVSSQERAWQTETKQKKPHYTKYLIQESGLVGIPLIPEGVSL